MEKVEQVNKLIKEKKLKKVKNGKFESYVIEVALTTGKKLDVRIKNYGLAALIDEVGLDAFTITYETRKSKEGNEFDCFVISLPSLEYEDIEFFSREHNAIINLQLSKK